MRKKSIMAIMGIVVMMAMVAVLSVGSQTKANACSFFKKKVEVNIYTGNENVDGFNVQVVKTKLTAKKLIKALQSKGAVAKGVKVRSFADNDTNLVLNLSQAFADDVATCGTSGEFVKVGSVVNTFLDAYDAQTILIKVEGKAWESGHVVYDEPLSMMGMEQQEPEEPVNPAVDVNVYVGNENANGFNVKTVQIDELNAENLIKALQAEGAVASGVKVNSFRDIGTNLILDLSREFVDDVCNSGTSGEYIKVGCVVNTFLDAYGSSEILITVNDDPWESGHAMYDNTLTRYENQPTNPTVDVNVYVGNENADGFNVKTVQIDELNAENLIKALQAEGAVANGVKVNSFRDIGTNLILDLSREFVNDVCSSGTAGEYIKVGCVVNTFLDAYGSSEILITVNDDPWESGHAMYDNTLTKYE